MKLNKKNIIIFSSIAGATLVAVLTVAVIFLTGGRECEHAYNEITVKAATCTEAGTAYDECTLCGEKTEERQIPATGHRQAEMITPATCTDEGRAVTACADCDHVESEVIPAKGHSMNGEPTCTEDAVCVNCGYVSAATGHTNPRYTSCTENGTCRNCGEVIAEPRGHSEPFGATCQRGGVCIWCDKVLGEPKPHTNKCTNGSVEGVCSRCGEDVGIPLEHSFNGMHECYYCPARDVNYYVSTEMGSSFELKHEDTHYRITLVKLEKNGTCTGSEDGITITADKYFLYFTVENLGVHDSSVDTFWITADFPYAGNSTLNLGMCVRSCIDYNDDNERRDGIVQPGEIRDAKMLITDLKSGLYKVEFKLLAPDEEGRDTRGVYDEVCLEYDLDLNEYEETQ